MTFHCVYCNVQLFGENKFSCEACKLERYNQHTQRYVTESRYVRFDYTKQETKKKAEPATVPVAAQFLQTTNMANDYFNKVIKHLDDEMSRIDKAVRKIDSIGQQTFATKPDRAKAEFLEEMVSLKPSTTNLYSGISAERQDRIRVDIEKDLRAELTAELTPKIKKQVAKDLEQERQKNKAHPEDIAAARNYFKEVELTALSLSTVLASKRKEALPSFAPVPAFFMSLGLALIPMIIMVLIGVPLAFCAMPSLMLALLVAHITSYKSVTRREKYDELIRTANSIAGSAKAARSIYLSKSFSRKELLDLIEEVRSEQIQLDALYAATPQELETARIACEPQVVEDSDDFMTRLRNRQAEEEEMSAEEDQAERRTSK